MHEKVLAVENMVVSLQYCSFLPGRKIGPKNCAILKNCARCWGKYLKSLVITKKYRLRLTYIPGSSRDILHRAK